MSKWSCWGALALTVCTGYALAQPAISPEAQMPQVIVKFKPQSTLLRSQVLAVQRAQSQAQALGARVNMALSGHGAVAEHTQVVTGPANMSASALAAQLASEPDVEYAVPDQKRYTQSVPNDPLFLTGSPSKGPVSGQWYLRAPNAETKASINAVGAWNRTTGQPSVVVAILDTGVRFDHPDLLPVTQGGNLLPGYDMITEVGMANDGSGRDADASDPGDWLTMQDLSSGDPSFKDCKESPDNSSWHGTRTAGLIAAQTNNGMGMAGVGRTVRVLPVRVLGKCGGRDSDIIAGMRWAAGLHIDGVPENLYPAQVINLSLGSKTVDTCSAAYLDVMKDLAVVGVTVVASVGNATGEAVSSPANCPGVLAVAGLQHTGAKVGFSNLGPEVVISAPAGNCVNGAGPCLYPILTTTNTGLNDPIPNEASYTDSFNYSVGTSFAAPLVSGTVALMLSLRPDLHPSQIKQILQSTARAFPTTGAISEVDSSQVKTCTVPQYDRVGTPIPQLQCYCTTSTCGAGMLDAGAAVKAAITAPVEPPLPGLAAFSSSNSGSGGGAVGGAWLLGLLSGTLVLAAMRWRHQAARRRVSVCSRSLYTR